MSTMPFLHHCSIVRNKKICGGNPIIRGTRIVDIVIEYEYLGYSTDEIVNAHPYLSLSQVHDVLSYYYENREQIDEEIRKRKEEINKLSEAALKYHAAKN